MKKRLYVAYGSNLNMAQMALRCPEATVEFTGYLNNWEMVFCRCATIRRKSGSTVPVAVWSISESDEKSLDRYEGYPYLYRKENIFVTRADGSRKKAMVYIMNRGIESQPPSSYVKTIKDGYEDFGFDLEYLEDLVYQNWVKTQKRGR